MIRFFLISFFIFSIGRAQVTITDSLQNVIDSPSSTNWERMEAMGVLSRTLALNEQFIEAIAINNKAQQISRLEKDKKYSALSFSALCYIHTRQDSLKLAFQAIDSAQWYAAQTEDKIIKGRVFLRKGWLEHIIENPDKAYKNMLNALRLLEGEEDVSLYRSNIYHYLAAIEGYWKNLDKQVYYTKLCLNEAIKSGNPDAEINAYLSMGTSHLYRFRKEQQGNQQLLDSSKYFFKQILGVTDSQKKAITLKSTRGIAALNMANIYFEFYPISYKDSANTYLNIALDVGKEVNNAEIIANSYGILSEYALKEKNYNRAETLLLMAYTEITKYSGEIMSKSRITNALARVAEKNGNTNNALKYYKQYIHFDKQLFDKEKLSIAQKLEAQYQSEKKELALSAAKQEAAFSQKINHFYVILMIVGVISLFFLFRSYHFKLKTSQQQQLLLTSEKNEAELQASLKAEETARLKAERELMAERLDRLEKELLAGTLQVEEKNTLLKDLKEKLNSLDANDPLQKQINRLISKSYEVDKDYEELKAEFVDIRPEFIAKLQEKAENKLTRLDLKYCSYILMGLSNKEIASKLNVDPKSIRMARYRLKQKLNLLKEESLDKFINDLGINKK